MNTAVIQRSPLTITLLLMLLAFHTVNGQSNGQIVKLTEEVVASAGAAAVINCTVSSPDPSVKDLVFVEWAFLNATGGAKTLTKDCSVIEEHNEISGRKKYVMSCDELQSINTLYSLKVDMLSFPDNGWYECRVRLSNEPLPVDTMRVTLTVLSPPKIQTSATPLTIDAFLNSTVAIPCSAEGIPGPNVTWSRANGRPLSPERTLQIRNKTSTIVTSQTLMIENITRDDSGTYRCSADNNIRPPDEFLARLAVQYKPSVAPVEPSYGTSTGEHTQVMVWCRVEGNPRPDMTWYGMTREDSERYERGELELDDAFFANAKTIVTDEKYGVEQKIMTVGRLSTIDSMFISLSLYTVEPGDMVYYVCKAENTHGRAATGVKLYRITTFASQSGATSINSLSVLMVLMFIATFCLSN